MQENECTNCSRQALPRERDSGFTRPQKRIRGYSARDRSEFTLTYTSPSYTSEGTGTTGHHHRVRVCGDCLSKKTAWKAAEYERQVEVAKDSFEKLLMPTNANAHPGMSSDVDAYVVDAVLPGAEARSLGSPIHFHNAAYADPFTDIFTSPLPPYIPIHFLPEHQFAEPVHIHAPKPMLPDLTPVDFMQLEHLSIHEHQSHSTHGTTDHLAQTLSFPGYETRPCSPVSQEVETEFQLSQSFRAMKVASPAHGKAKERDVPLDLTGFDTRGFNIPRRG